MEDKRKRTRKSMLIFAAIVGGFVVLGILFRLTGFMSFGSTELSGAENISERHIGVLYISEHCVTGQRRRTKISQSLNCPLILIGPGFMNQLGCLRCKLFYIA